MQKFLYALLLVLFVALSACSKEPAAAEQSVDTAATTEAAEECVLDPPAEPGMCTMEWDPVCGCDGVTYGNACGAKAAGVPRYTEGACDEDEPDEVR